MSKLMRDVIVIGGGPAGSTAATLLAQRGFDVLLLERERFPRFQIGESLLPYNNDLLNRLGVTSKLEVGEFFPKYGAEFVTGDLKSATPSASIAICRSSTTARFRSSAPTSISSSCKTRPLAG